MSSKPAENTQNTFDNKAKIPHFSAIPDLIKKDYLRNVVGLLRAELFPEYRIPLNLLSSQNLIRKILRQMKKYKKNVPIICERGKWAYSDMLVLFPARILSGVPSTPEHSLLSFQSVCWR